MRRSIVVGAVLAAAALGLWAAPAAAHNEWEPATAAPGSIVDLTLFAEDELPDAGTTQLDLQFPEPITVVALPEVPGWTATVVGGELGGAPATGVTWTGGPAPGDLELPITLGPLPSEPGRLQFRSVQTYDNGDVDSWIDDWPEGAPEPEHPGPVLDLVAGGPGSIPATTAAPATTTTSTTVASTTTLPAGDDQASGDEDDSNSSALPIVIGVLVVLAAAGGAYAVIRSRRASAAEPDDGGSSDTGTGEPPA